MNLQSIFDIIESGNWDDIKFICTAIIPNLKEEEILEIEKYLKNNGWEYMKDTYTPEGWWRDDRNDQKRFRTRNMKEVLENNISIWR